MHDVVGQVLGDRYRVRSVIGIGGMGTVFEAEDVVTNRSVAVKTLLPELAATPGLRSRFEREGHAAGFLLHPNIVEVFEMGSMPDGMLYLAMELVHGSSVAQLLDRGPVHPRRALVIARQTLLGLGYAHQLGLVHRDLKPDNIMVARAGEPGREYDQVKLLDFGVVKVLTDSANVFSGEKLTETGVTFGTPKYIAPEQAMGRPLDGRADLYSLGVVLFEMLTGRPPFDSEDSMDLVRMHISRPPPSLAQAPEAAPWCSAALDTLVTKLLAKAPEERYADARSATVALDEAFVSIDHVPGPAA